MKDKFGDDRRTEISLKGEVDFREEDLIPHQRMVVTVSNRGFVKRVPAQLYTVQHRGGKGITGMPTREDDAVKLLSVADTHDGLLFFTNRGKAFRLRCWEIPAASSRTAKGLAAINMFPIAEGERIADVMLVTAVNGRPGAADGHRARGNQEDGPGQLCQRAQQRSDRHGRRTEG